VVTAALAAILSLAAAAAADAPLGVDTPGTMRQLFLDVTSADARAPGALRLDVRWSLVNDWSTPTALVRGRQRVDVRDDEQADVVAARAVVPWSSVGPVADWALAPRLATTIEWRALAHWGGYSDGLVEAWHRFGHYTNFQRDLFPRGQVHLQLAQRGGATLAQIDGTTFAAGDLALRNQLLLASGGASLAGAASRWGVSARLDLKVPLGALDRLAGSGGPDVGVGLLGTAELSSWLTGHALVALSAWSRLPDAFALQPRRWHETAELSLAAHWGSYALVVEDRLVSPAFEGGWSLDLDAGFERPSTAEFALLRWHNQITVGMRRGPLSIWFSEDFTPGAWGGPTATWFYDSNAPDIVFGVSYQRGF
jgi:hypothetical protein